MKMRRSKRCGAWCLALLCLLLTPAALGEDTVGIVPFEAREDTIGLQRGTQLTVGTTTKMSGHFGTEAFSSNTSDMDARALLHGYPTIAWTRQLGAAVNSAVVAGVETVMGEGGNRTYVLSLHEDLTYSDGTRITAKDYCFAILLGGAKALQEVGGSPLSLGHIVGYDDYAAGKSTTISGVRLLDVYTFSLEISGEYLPFFYGMAMLNVSPYPPQVIAPGCDVVDDGSGIYLRGSLTADTLKRTLLDPSTGYEFHPEMTTGPYMLESYDAAAGQATFVVNEQFKGNYEGQKPHIERIVFRQVQNETMADALRGGEVDLLNKVSNPQAIAAVQAVVDENGLTAVNYLRTGFAFLSFACEEGPAASQAVRKAVALCLDTDALIEAIGGNAARRVYGYYGLGQWMASYTTDGVEGGGQPLDMPVALAELAVPWDIQAAKTLLEGDGWTLNAAGDPYVEGTDDLRYRKGANGLEPLVIRWAKTEDNAVADAIETLLTPAMAQAGMKLETTTLPFGEMMEHFYRQKPRTYDMFYLATNFSYVFDPYYDFNTADAYQGVVNTSGLRDEELMRLALEMRETSATDMDGYVTKWYAFQQGFVDRMPMIPLYSSVYFDYYDSRLQGYDIAAHPGWGHAVLYAYLQE